MKNNNIEISFIIPFCSIDKTKHLNIPSSWPESNYFATVITTMRVIKNIINTKVSENVYEIILVDNSHNWPDIDLPNVKVIKGFQGYTKEELIKDKEFLSHDGITNLDMVDWNNDTMWESLAYYKGIKVATGKYIILQHNDVFYHKSEDTEQNFENLITDLEQDDLTYIAVDSKKISLLVYLQNKELFDKYVDTIKFIPTFGGMLDTRDLGLADAYWFLARKTFFDNYDVDWKYGDTNHGATIYCLENDLNYLHLGPYYDNPSYDTQDTDGHNVYFYDGTPFLSHLKGGFSENKLNDNNSIKKFSEVLNENR